MAKRIHIKVITNLPTKSQYPRPKNSLVTIIQTVTVYGHCDFVLVTQTHVKCEHQNLAVETVGNTFSVHLSRQTQFTATTTMPSTTTTHTPSITVPTRNNTIPT